MFMLVKQRLKVYKLLQKQKKKKEVNLEKECYACQRIPVCDFMWAKLSTWYLTPLVVSWTR